MTGKAANYTIPEADAALARRGRVLLAAILVLSLAGLGVAIELSRIHYLTHTDPGFHSICAVSETVNCETVAESVYSAFLGLPVSVWGIFGYGAMALLAAAGLNPKRRSPSWPRGALSFLILGAFASACILAYFSFFRIDAMCIFCMALYAINTALLGIGIALVVRGGLCPISLLVRDIRATLAKPLLPLLWVLLAGGGIAAAELLIPAYWIHLGWRDLPELPTGADKSGHHWIGAENPLVTVIEYSDYECPHCRRAHRNIRQMAAKFADTVRLVHRHQPLDEACNPAVKQAFHARACEFSTAVECAGEQGKFWEMNDAIFSLQDDMPAAKVDLSSVAVELGLDRSRFLDCVRGEKPKARISKDIAEAERLGIRGTPTFSLNGQLYPGGFPESFLADAVNEARKGRADK